MEDTPGTEYTPPLPIRGYQNQPEVKIQLVNKNKELEERVLRAVDAMSKLPDVDQRWLAIGRTHLEQAFMAINRSILRPMRVSLPEDQA